MSQPEMRSDRLRAELAEVKRQRDLLREALHVLLPGLMFDLRYADDDDDKDAMQARIDTVITALKATEAP
jgi:hypothetical protein